MNVGAAAPGTFRDLSKEVVGRFLQTVVVLDDGAFIESPVAGEVREPDDDIAILEEEPEDDDGAAATDVPGVVNALDAQTLIRGFADRGLVCAVLAPGVEDEGSGVTIEMSRRADIVILDWQLKAGETDGDLAITIIRKIRDADDKAGGRLRMVVVYTATPDLEAVRATVRGAFGDCVDRAGGSVLALEAPHARILFIGKGSTAEQVGRIGERDLPGRVIDEFVEMGNGILANVTFACIAAVREETHRVLARFHRGMDVPFLTHRILLATPSDAEDYAVELVCSEVVAVLQREAIGPRYAGGDAIRLALAEREARGAEFRLMKAKDSAKDAKTITAEELMKLVNAGPNGLQEIAGGGRQRGLHERVYLLLSQELADGRAAHYEFARVSACVRERAGVPAGYRPTLSQGTIVGEEGRYWVCIQPVCEAVRLEGPAKLMFAALCNSATTFDVVVKDVTGKEICLELNTQTSAMRTISFDPDPDSGTIRGVADNAIQTFRSRGDGEFVWLCDLRTSLAQRFVHRIANNLSRIGLDEFEWQRRASRGKSQ